MDEHTFGEYGWIVIVVTIIAVLLAFAPSLGEALTTKEEALIADHFKTTYIQFTQQDINNLGGLFIPVGAGVGAVNSLDVIARVNDQHTALAIMPNGVARDVAMMDNLAKALIVEGINIENIRSVTIYDGINNIGKDAFRGFTSLEGIDIPASVVSIGSGAFNNCTSLTNITYAGTKEQWPAISFANEWDLNAHSYELIINNEVAGAPCAIILDNSGSGTADVTPLVFGYSILKLQPGDFYNSEVYGKLRVKAVYDTFETTTAVLWSGYSGEITSVTVEDPINPISMASWFSNMSMCTKMDLRLVNTSKVTDMSRLFQGCSALTELDLSNLKTTNVATMEGMFEGCSSLALLNLTGFDTAKVTSMKNMFKQCARLTKLDVSRFDTSQVTDMSHMFESCAMLTTLNLYNFSTVRVSNMASMFAGAANLTTLDFSRFNTHMVTDMSYMFFNASRLTTLNVSSFNTVNVTNMAQMFNGCASLVTLSVSNFDTSFVTDMQYMFANCANLSGLNLSSFNTLRVTNMSHMFSCAGLASPTWSLSGIAYWNTRNVQNMNGMFEMVAPAAEYSVDLSYWVVEQVTDYSNFSAGVDTKITPPAWKNGATKAA